MRQVIDSHVREDDLIQNYRWSPGASRLRMKDIEKVWYQYLNLLLSMDEKRDILGKGEAMSTNHYPSVVIHNPWLLISQLFHMIFKSPCGYHPGDKKPNKSTFLITTGAATEPSTHRR